MKYPHMIQSIVLSTLLLGCSIQAEINNHQESSFSAPQGENSEIAEFAEDMVARAFTALQKIENKLTEIAMLVQKGKFKGINPQKIMQVLIENKMSINALLQNQAALMTINDPEQHLEITFIISEFSKAFISYLDKQIQNNFKNAQPFNPNRFMKNLHKGKTRNNFDHLQPEALKKGLRITNAKLKNLNATVKNIGLTWYNKAARSLDKWVITPANKWHLPTVALYGTGIGVLSLYTLYSCGWPMKNREDAPQWIKDFLNYAYANNCGPIARAGRGGQLIVISSETDTSDNKVVSGHTNNIWGGAQANQNNDLDFNKLPDNACMLATIDYNAKEIMTGNQPITAMGMAYVLAGIKELWSKPGGIHETLVNKRDLWWNFLRGGEYLNTYQPRLVAMEPTVSFKDMVGLDEVKKEFSSILQYINNPEQLMRIDATPEKGWLLTGPPRTGKTFSAECLCGEIKQMMAKRGQADKVKFYNIHASLINEFGIRDIFNEVHANAPAVLFIDEIDLLGLVRVGNNKLLSEFLTTMQSSMNSDPAKVVIVIAATNKPENIDSALRQNGRFGKEIRFDYPSKKYRAKFLNRELTNMALNVKEFDIETLTDKTNDKTFEDLKRIVRNAMTRSWMRGGSLTQELLEESIDTELHNVIMFNRKELPENERRIVATHFAGMALAALHLETHEQLDKVTTHAYMAEIQDRLAWDNYAKDKEKNEQKKIEYGKLITKQSHDTINAKSEALILNDVTLLLAGFAAEELLLGPCGFTCHESDREKAQKIIEKLVFGGLNQTALPKTIREELMMKAHNLLEACQKNVMNLLANHRDALVAITEELMQKQILNDKEIKAIIKATEDKIAAIEPQITEADVTETKETDTVIIPEEVAV